MAEPAISIDVSEERLQAEIRERVAGRRGLPFTLPLLAAVGILYWRALPEYTIAALGAVHVAVHVAGGLVGAAVLFGLLLGPGRREGRVTTLSIRLFATDTVETETMRDGVISDTQRRMLENIARFDIEYRRTIRRSWATFRIVPDLDRAARPMVHLFDGTSVPLTPFALPDLAEVADLAERLNHFLRKWHLLREQETKDDGPSAFKAKVDPRAEPGNWKKAGRVVFLHRLRRLMVWLPVATAAAVVGFVGWHAPPLRREVNPWPTLRDTAMALLETRGRSAAGVRATRGGMKARAATGGTSRPPGGDAVTTRGGGEASLRVSDELMHVVVEEPYPFEMEPLTALRTPVVGRDTSAQLGAALTLYQEYQKRQAASRPALDALARLLDHADERLGVTAAAALGEVGDASYLKPLKTTRERIIGARKAREGRLKHGDLLARTMEAITKIEEREREARETVEP